MAVIGVNSGQTIASLRGVSKSFGQQLALDQVDLGIKRGEMLAVLGPNGAGKTTALGLLTGRLRADRGQVELFGRDPTERRARQRIGVMIQEAALPDTLCVGELVRLFSSYYPAPRTLADSLTLSGLEGIAGQRYGGLSGGQKRRVQFALAICGRPELLFVDEPTVGLDVEARRNFWRVLRALRDDGVAIVMTTHYIEEADALADRVLLLATGRVLAEGTPAGIKARASGKRLCARTGLAAEQIARWPEVQTLSASDGRIECQSDQVEALLRRLLAADPGLSELEVLPLSLEEAFVTLNQQAPPPARPPIEDSVCLTA